LLAGAWRCAEAHQLYIVSAGCIIECQGEELTNRTKKIIRNFFHQRFETNLNSLKNLLTRKALFFIMWIIKIKKFLIFTSSHQMNYLFLANFLCVCHHAVERWKIFSPVHAACTLVHAVMDGTRKKSYSSHFSAIR